ncbi:MAG: LysM peptidoglycan-binding domain-containing protein [Firmicutes bacterium]|nr:LysM peptidoglycan-binding domain-containing protein [Bacillota bacterium]
MIIHKVKETETIRDIAAFYKVPANIILSYNKTLEICFGDYLKIPKIEGKIYKIKPFDTLEKISRRFNVPPEEILKKNGIDNVYPFLEIII